jgi:hypothetical protein
VIGDLPNPILTKPLTSSVQTWWSGSNSSTIKCRIIKLCIITDLLEVQSHTVNIMIMVSKNVMSGIHIPVFRGRRSLTGVLRKFEPEIYAKYLEFDDNT